MKKVININFQGRVIPIEEAAYELLKQYIDNLHRFFANEEGKDEIINDIEGRIAELLGDVLKKGSTCITENDVQAVISSIGNPEEFEGEEANIKSQLGANDRKEESGYNRSYAGGSQQGYTRTGNARFYRDENNKVVAGVCSGIANYFDIDPLVVRILFIVFSFGFGFGFITYLVLWVAAPSTASTVIGSPKKRLFRDPDNKIIAGVCSGLAQYFGLNIWIPRALFIIPFLSFVFRWSHWAFADFPSFINLTFSPGALLVYIILWLVLPEATTTSEKLEMKGERVDLNSIKNTIQQDMEGFKDRAEKFGREVGDRAQEAGRQFGTNVGRAARQGGSGLGHAIAIVVKIFVYFILGCILFSLVIGLFSGGIALTGLLPVKGYLINEGWQSAYVWGILILFIWVPVIGIITWIIRRVSNRHGGSRGMRIAFISLWLLGIVCVVALVVSLRDDFRYESSINEQPVQLSNPGVAKLELKRSRPGWYNNHRVFRHFTPFTRFDDTVYINNLRLRIIKSDDSGFHVSMARQADGRTRQQANQTADRISYNISQKDSTLYLDRGIKIYPQDKFRNQSVYVTVAVPVGKRIMVDDNVDWNNHFSVNFWDDEDWRYSRDFYDDSEDWDNNVEYVMTPDGLKRTHPEKDDDGDE